MFDSFQDKASIKNIAKTLPKKLVKDYGKQEFYTQEQVDTIFLASFKEKLNIQYAYAMFCLPQDFAQIAKANDFTASYSELRLEISEVCFESWPRFNFDSLLHLSSESPLPDLVNEVTDIGLDLLR